VIAVVSDTHLPRGGRRLPEACVELLGAADVVIHAGDLVRREVLDELRAVAPRVEAVHGNGDDAEVSALLPKRTVVEAEGLRIGVVHIPGPAVGRHERLRSWFPGCDVVVYGHTHAPEVHDADGLWILNPGSPTVRRRAPTHTMAVIEAGAPRLVDLVALV
jgi:putative phosphoesterase